MDSTRIKDNNCEEFKGIFDAASLTIQWLSKGFAVEKVDDITQKLRISVCQACDNFEKTERRCLECCCPMDFKTTLRFDPIKTTTNFRKTKTACPIGKW